MSQQNEAAQLFHRLHNKGNPLILFNVWDAGSAKAVKESDTKAIGTSSWAVAAAHGYDDGEQLPFNLVLANLKRIIKQVDVPVTVDIEAGYATSLAGIQENIKKIITAGAVGINFEDQIIGKNALYSIAEQCERIKAIRQVAEQIGVNLFINARSDIFLLHQNTANQDVQLEEAVLRAQAYAAAGANGFFIPGLIDPGHIEILCQLSPIAVNIMTTLENLKPTQLAAIGVSRVSYGPEAYCQTILTLKNMAKQVL